MKKNRHMPKSLIMKGMRARGLTANRVTINGNRVWEVKNIKTGETAHIPTLELVYTLFLAEKKKNSQPKPTTVTDDLPTGEPIEVTQDIQKMEESNA